jgi:L-lactate dehydrogenase complex protein LldG
MNARDVILNTLRGSLRGVSVAPLPPLDGDWISYPDLEAQFISAASELPAQVVVTTASFIEVVEGLDVYRNATNVLSLVEGVGSGPRILDDPHEAASLDLTIARGQIGVAESGAIWVTGQGMSQRSALFLAQHLVLLLDRKRIVPHLLAAYEQLDVTEDAYGCFIAGPSKTADIEQALVVGAHGPRSATIVLHA